MGKTNSNSITAILVNKLNYKKSGFRAAILKLWGLPDDIRFKDGTHCPTNIPEMEGTEVDIIGETGTKIVLLLEVKASLNEPLQDSQGKHGEYKNTVNAHSEIKLKYIIPDGYRHFDELSKESYQIEIITWSKMYEIAKEYDNTGFTEQIDCFVESQFHTNDLLLSKGDVAMFLSPSIIGQVNVLYSRIKRLMEGFVSFNNIKLKYKKDCELGWYYGFEEKKYRINTKGSEDVWIGLCEMNNSKYTFFMAPWGINTLENYEEKKDFFIENQKNGSQIYIPITEENNGIPEFLYSETADDQQKKFNKLMSHNIEKLLNMLGKN